MNRPSALAPTDATHGAYGVQEHFIGGRFVPSVSGETFASINPASNELLALAASGEAADIDAAVGAARRAFDAGEWPRLKAQQRADVLRAVAAGIREHAGEFIDSEVADIGMPMAQMAASRPARPELRLLRRGDPGAVWPVVSGRRRVHQLHDSQAGGRGRADHAVERAADALHLADRPALAAGNTVVLKPAEWSPLTATLLAAVLDEAGVPAGAFNVVQGYGETAGAALSTHPGVDLICFTGETTTGQTIIAAGAPTLKRSSSRAGRQVPGRRL